MSVLDSRRELLDDKKKFDSFIRDVVSKLLLSLDSLDETHPVWQFNEVFRDCEVTVTVELRGWGRSDYEPSHGHPTVQP